MTGQILPRCPQADCALWTQHSHEGVLVAPVPTKVR